jgi:hypothetical protein
MIYTGPGFLAVIYDLGPRYSRKFKKSMRKLSKKGHFKYAQKRNECMTFLFVEDPRTQVVTHSKYFQSPKYIYGRKTVIIEARLTLVTQ